jgi:hypothetical protein
LIRFSEDIFKEVVGVAGPLGVGTKELTLVENPKFLSIADSSSVGIPLTRFCVKKPSLSFFASAFAALSSAL